MTNPIAAHSYPSGPDR